MNFRTHRARARADVWLDMTPLIDLVFNLLIFFLLTTNYTTQHESSVSIRLPEGSGESSESPGDEVAILIDSQGAITLAPEGVEAYPVPFESIERELTTLFETNPTLSIVLRGDRDADYGRVMEIFLLARRVGFPTVRAVVEQPTPSPP